MTHPTMSPRLEAALQALREGRAVVLADDDERENEADLIVAADRLTEPMMALLIRARRARAPGRAPSFPRGTRVIGTLRGPSKSRTSI